jgi:signal peptidase I
MAVPLSEMTMSETLPTPTSTSPSTPPPSVWQSLWRDWLRPFLLVAGVMVAFRSSVLDWNVVPTGSMKPTIVEGDYILVNKLAYDLRVPLSGQRLATWADPKRGDIIVFEPPGEHERYVKRIVGVPGDILELRDNHLLVNGRPAVYHDLHPTEHADALSAPQGDWLGEETVAGRSHAVMLSPDRASPASFEPLVVPEGHYFVMGDNRDNSKDSRYFGFVSRERIVGRAGSVAVSLDPEHHQTPRWHRFFGPLT